MKKGMTRRCPKCGTRLTGIKTDWHLIEVTINGHQVATIGSSWNAADDIRSAVEFQMATNLAAYRLDYDAELNLGFRGTAWVQCPEAREAVTDVCVPK